jgi:hypothetical protein
MKRIVWSLGLCCLIGWGASARGDVCHIEHQPSASLLLPYFEVDTTSSSGSNTAFAIVNGVTAPVLVKAEVWTNLGVPVFGFNLYLNGHDVQTVNLFDVLINGNLPPTSPPPGMFPSCLGVLPPATIAGSTLSGYQQALLGHSSSTFGGSCGGLSLGDSIARGYITFDTVSVCSTLSVGDSGYFGVATNKNALWGDYQYVNAGAGANIGFPLVNIRASGSDPATTTSGNYTFYGKFVNWTAADNRQPLPTNFGVRYFNSPPFNSDLFVWRDSKVRQGPFTCGTLPAWYPLKQERVIAYDEASNSVVLAGTLFPAVTQRTHINTLGIPYTFGWLYLDLNETVAAAGPLPPVDPAAAQAWVTSQLIFSTVSVGLDAMNYDTACSAQHTTP